MENNWFPLARMKNLFQNYISNVWKIDKTMASLDRESALTNQNAGPVYKYVPIRRKSKTISGRSVWKWKKKMIFTSQKISFHWQKILKNWICAMVSSSRKKSSNKRILFQVDITSVSTSKNGEFASE